MRPKVKNLDVKEGVCYIVAGDRATGKQWSNYQDNDMNRNIATEMPVTREKNGANRRLGDAVCRIVWLTKVPEFIIIKIKFDSLFI